MHQRHTHNCRLDPVLGIIQVLICVWNYWFLTPQCLPSCYLLLSLLDGNTACLWCSTGQAGPGQSESGGPRRRHQKLNFLRDLQEGLPWPLHRVLHRWAEHGTHNGSDLKHSKARHDSRKLGKADNLGPLIICSACWSNLLLLILLHGNLSHFAWPVTCVFALHCTAASDLSVLSHWCHFYTVVMHFELTVVMFLYFADTLFCLNCSFMNGNEQLNEVLCNVQ